MTQDTRRRFRGKSRATGQHQITIPQVIWKALQLEVGASFDIVLTDDRQIVATPEPDALNLSDEEWKQLVHLAHDDKNVTHRSQGAKDAISRLKKL